jgi:hypothetical protein
MKRNSLTLLPAVICGMGAVIVAPVATSTADVSDPTTQYAQLLASSTPKTVVLDPTTGAIISVSLGEPVGIASPSGSPNISGDTDCEAGDGCYYTPTINDTYHNRSFYGSAGTFTGSWPHRNAWDSGSYTASVCWQGGCSATYGPNTYVSFNGSIVTGTSFTIY